MKRLLLGLSLILGSTSFGRDFTKQTDGRIVEYTVIDGKVTFKQVGNMHAGSMYWGLHDIACGPINPLEKYRTFSGRVTDYNIGTPQKGIPIFMAVDDKAPFMVAISDDDGKFSFRIYQTENLSNNPGCIFAKEYKKANLYVGFLGAFNNPRPEPPSIGKPLPVGSRTSEYSITDILK